MTPHANTSLDAPSKWLPSPSNPIAVSHFGWHAGFMDPRIYQISALAGLLIYGLGWLDFEIGAAQAVVTLGGVLLTQWICSRIWRLERFDPRSALISGLSLCLLFRTNHLALALA